MDLVGVHSAAGLIDGLRIDWLLAGRAYDTEEVLAKAAAIGAEAAIPLKSNRRVQREIDLHSYKQWHLVENAFEWLMR